MSRRTLNPDDFVVESFVAGLNPVTSVRAGSCSGDGCTVWTTCGGCDCTTTETTVRGA
jgi:hypothetical protein